MRLRPRSFLERRILVEEQIWGPFARHREDCGWYIIITTIIIIIIIVVVVVVIIIIIIVIITIIIIVVIIIIIRGPRMATRLLPTLLALISLFFPHCTALGKLQICYYQFTLHQIIKNLHFLLTFRMHVNIIHQHNYFNCIVYLFEYQSCNILFQKHLRFYEKSMEESSLPRMQDVFRVLTQFLSNNLTLFCPIQLPFKKVLICFLALALFFTITKF